MKLLVFEFITGGGLSSETLPASLAHEGSLMLQALLEDLIRLPELQLTVPIDYRQRNCLEYNEDARITWVNVSEDDDFESLWQRLLNANDAVWVIAPETGSLLAKFIRSAQNSGKKIFGCDLAAIQLCSDKFLTYSTLTAKGIACVETNSLDKIGAETTFPLVIKPRDGVGCEQIQYISNRSDLIAAKTFLPNPDEFLIQPYEEGESLSLSVLFYQGKAWLLSVNRQSIEINQGCFTLKACTVNCESFENEDLADLCQCIALAIPGLWGYVGIDLIRSEKGFLVLEINPRLTSSYVGLRPAFGYNVAQLILQLDLQEPQLLPQYNRACTVPIQSENNEVRCA